MSSWTLIEKVTTTVLSAGELLAAEWSRAGGPRGCGDKADVDIEIEALLRRELLEILACDFWGEETGSQLTGHKYCWVVRLISLSAGKDLQSQSGFFAMPSLFWALYMRLSRQTEGQTAFLGSMAWIP